MKFLTTKQIAQKYHKSIRSVNQRLVRLIGTEYSYKVKEGHVYKNYYRQDKVDEYLSRKRVQKNRRRCMSCGKMFVPTGACSVCDDCLKVQFKDKNGQPQVYDFIALKALWLVLTDEKWWKKAMSLIAFCFILATTMIVGGKNE